MYSASSLSVMTLDTPSQNRMRMARSLTPISDCARYGAALTWGQRGPGRDG